MRWSIEELIYGLKVASNSGYKIIYRIINLPIALWRILKVIIHWIFTGYCWTTIWGLDYYLIEVFIKRFKQFKKLNRIGYPYDLSGSEEWEDIIDRLIIGFENMRDEKFLNYPDIELSKISESEEDKKLIRTNINKQRLYDKETLELFSKYFRAFWD